MKDKISVQVDSSQRGFTLLEVSIATVVLLVGLLSIIGISAYVSRANATSNTLSVLATLAQDTVDTLRAAKWTRKSEANGTDDPRIRIGGTVNLYHTSGDYHLDTNHVSRPRNTAAGDLLVLWQVSAGPTPDTRYVTVRVTQPGSPPFLSEGVMISTIIHRR